MEEHVSSNQEKSPPAGLKKYLAWGVTKTVIGLAILVVLFAVEIASDPGQRLHFGRLERQAYTALSQFAPWNEVIRYVQIVTMPDGTQSAVTRQGQRFDETLRSLGCSSNSYLGRSETGACQPAAAPRGLQAFYLSAHVPFVFRPITAFIDLILHSFLDFGLVGFLVVVAQVAIGFFITAYLIWRKWFTPDSFYGFILGVPFLALAAGSVAAAPIWVLAIIGKGLFEASPLAQLSFQGVCTACVVYLCKKKAEAAVEEFLIKYAQRFLR